MKILAIDTSTEACSAALHAKGATRERHELAPQRHAELILAMCEAVLTEAGIALAQIDGLAFGRGPGSFTGLRIAAGIIQGMALGTGCRVVGVSSLAAMAQGAHRIWGAERAIAAIDARMGEIYYGAFALDASGLMQAVMPECICTAAEAAIPGGHDWIGVGSGFNADAERLRFRLAGRMVQCHPDCYPHARDVVSLALPVFARGEAVEAERALPVYLRDRVADVSPG